MQENTTTKYIVHAQFKAEGFVERSDVVGAIFGQTEGLLGEDLDLRDLQKSGRIGRIEVTVSTHGGKSSGDILIPSSLDKVETALLAAALETIDRVGPCIARVEVKKIEDVRAEKRRKIVERAKELLRQFTEESLECEKMVEEVREALKVEEITQYKGLPAGPNVENADAIIIVEGRADVLNLLKCGIRNVVAVEGTNIPEVIVDLCRRKTVTAFFDGDRGGELILKELLQVADVDYVALAPEGKSVEDMTYKEIVKALQNKIPVEQYEQMLERKEHQQHKLRLSRKRSRDSAAAAADAVEDVGGGESAADDEKNTQSSLAPLTQHQIEHQGGKRAIMQFLKALHGTFNAVMLDDSWNIVMETSVRELVNNLRTCEEVTGVVFDGVITQRIIDVATEKHIKFVAGLKKGEIVRAPVFLKIFTLSDDAASG